MALWKRLKQSRDPRSNHVLSATSSVASVPEDLCLSATTEPSTDLPQGQLSLPQRSLEAAPGLTLPARHGSALSDVNAQLFSPHRRQRSQDRRDDPLGLLVLHTPPDRAVDIVFVHGLGGTSLRTWCHDRNLGNLWPKIWLPEDLPTARVLTFGYNAHFASSKKEQASSTISDFATDLLFRMKYGENTPERLGQVPIIFVVHSMGGLVFKKAFVQGHLNPEFNEIISMIKGALFLATPHRGADLAETLNKLLASSFLRGHSPKEYIAELARRSPTIDDLNEAFRHHASKLRLFSFYETLATTAGPVSITVVDKPTAVMGYPNETQAPLAADHHTVCKFASRNDPNYTAVVGALRSVADTVAYPSNGAASGEDLASLRNLLGVTGPPEEDLSSRRSFRLQGTCESFFDCEEVHSWRHSEKPQQILWAHAPPGFGKSVLCSFVIDHLLEAGDHCSYFFFHYGQQNKRSTSVMLQSLAYQTALQLPAFRRALVNMAKSGASLSKADASTIWDKVFSPHLSHVRTEERIYWVLDGLDEAESTNQVVKLISRIAEFEHSGLQLAKRKIDIAEMPLPDNQKDIQRLVENEIDDIPPNDGFNAKAAKEIVVRAQGSFLWASLVTKQVAKCHRAEQVKRVLGSTPDGMQDLYDGMMDAMMDLDIEDKALARLLLTWAVYSKTPVTIDELSEIYPTELGSITDLSYTISQVCGQFVVVDVQGRLSLVDDSARAYLKTKHRPFTLETEHSNGELLQRCLATLGDRGLRRKLRTLKVPKFLPYAAASWAGHLEESSADSNQVLGALVKFFSGPSPLAWIQYLAMSGRLPELLGASQILAAYVTRRRRADVEKSPMLHRVTHLSLLETWAADLIKIPAKFGRHLTSRPSLIYECIPALSPTSSIMHQKFSENPATALTVSGLSNEKWDDCLARVSGGLGKALQLAASPLYLAVASDEPKGTVTVWDAKLFEEHKVFAIGEHIWSLCFSNSGSLLACYSLSSTFVWKVGEWTLQASAPNPGQTRAIAFSFDDNDCVMMVSESRKVYKLQTQSLESSWGWEPQSASLLDESGVPEGTWLGTPSCVAFNGDCTQIAVAYPTFPLSIWTVDPPEMIARLRRKHKPGKRSVHSYTGTNHVVWNPAGNEVICVFGQIFKWSPEDDAYDEVEDESGVAPNGLACSPDGRVFVTMDVLGNVKIFDVASMTLVYKLSSEDMITRICFAPDSLRFYDLRGSYCNIWEPDCLLRLADTASERVSGAPSTASDDFWSDTADDDTRSTSISIPVFESHAENRPAITAVDPGQAASPGFLIAHANDDGSINMYDTMGQRKHEVARTKFKMTSEHLAWSPKQEFLAYSLTRNGATTVLSIVVDGSRSISAEVVYSETKPPTDRGRTRQLLFHPTSNRLLICGVKKCQIFSLPDGAVLAECHLSPDSDAPARWQQHPSDPQRLLRFSARSATAFSWDTLQEKGSIPLDLSPTKTTTINSGDTDDQPPAITLDAILDSHSPHFLLLRTFTMHCNVPRYGFAILPARQLYAATTTTTTTTDSPSSSSNPTTSPISQPDPHSTPHPPPLTPLPLPPSLTTTITHPLAILPSNTLLFLDRQLRVCTASLSAPISGPSTNPEIKRHFFLPHDWVQATDLRLGRVLRDGRVLCPCRGQVAVLEGGLDGGGG